jgi:hypothetical protein
VNVAVVIVDALITSLNVTVIVVFTSTPVALLSGLLDKTVGGVFSLVSGIISPQPVRAAKIIKGNKSKKIFL